MLASKQSIGVYTILRISCAMCFIGHGTFGIITKAIWCNYFAVFGIGKETSYTLMPYIGVIDILMGIAMIAYPVRGIAVWLIIWGAFTALLRPLSGEPFAEFVERAGNYGAPLCLLIWCGVSFSWKGLFAKMEAPVSVQIDTMQATTVCLRWVVFFLLLGHGWLNMLEKKSLLDQYSGLGCSNPPFTAQAIGIFEIISAVIILFKPLRPVLIALFVWKMASELLYPQYELFEWIERGGSYGSLLALWMITAKKEVVLKQSSFIFPSINNSK